MGVAEHIVPAPSVLSTADEAFGAEPQKTLPTADEAFGDKSAQEESYNPFFQETIHPFINHFVDSLARTAVEKVVKNIADTGEAPSIFGYAKQVPGLFEKGTEEAIKGGAQLGANVIAPALTPEDRTRLENAGLYNQSHIMADKIRNSGQPITGENYKQLLADGIMQSPVGQFSSAVYSTLLAPVAPLFDVATGAAQKMGASAGDVGLATAGLAILGVAHSGGAKGKTAEALENHVLGSEESTFMGETDPHPVMSEVAHKAAEVNAPPETAAPAQAAAEFDINKVARNIAPDLFSEADRLDTRREVLRQTMRNGEEIFGKEVDDKIAELEKEREPLTRAPTDLEGDELHKAVQENTARGAQIDEQIRQLKASRADYIKEQTAAAQKEFVDNFNSRAALGPQVRKAYEAAEEYRNAPPEEAEPPKAAEEQPPVAAPLTETPPVVADNKIAENVSKDLQEAGRPEEEANASAALVAAHYQAVADLGWAKGTAQEIYEKHAPAIVKGEAKKAKRVRELSQTPKEEFNQSVFHGSPHHFDKFTLEHIGSGEGAQAYGWGLYFASNKKIAEFYRETLSRSQPNPWPEAVKKALEKVDNLGFDSKNEAMDAIRKHKDWKQRWDVSGESPEDIKVLEEYAATPKKKGQLYEADIPESHEMLHWDKPLGEQPEGVKEALRKASDKSISGPLSKAAGKEMISHGGTYFNMNTKAGDFYDQLAKAFEGSEKDIEGSPKGWGAIQRGDGGQKPASEYLNSLGIKGIQYLDNTSRSKGEGSHNFVVFDDSAIKTLRTYYQSGARGSFLRPFGDFEGGVIGLRPTSDASTLIHEMGHAWLDEMERFAREPDAPQTLTDAHKTVRDWLKVKEGAELTRAQHEKFARGFERYLMEGIAPSKGLAKVFAQFKKWLTDIYQKVKNLRSPITDEIRGVFDQMLAAHPEKTIFAPDHEPGKMAADIHEADAKTTPAPEKDSVGDTVEKEVDSTAKLHEPEVADAIKAAETGNVPETVTGNTSAANAGQPTGEGGVAQKSGTVSAGGGEPASRRSGLGKSTEAGSGPPSAVTNPGKPASARGSGEGLIDKAGNIRLDLLSKKEDINDLMRQMAEENGGYADAQGPAVTQRDISDYAGALGVEESKINIEKLKAMTRVDGIPLAFRIRAARVMLKQSADAVKKLGDNADQWGEDDAVNYVDAKARHVMIAKTVSGITAEWGRAGHALRDISGDEAKTMQNITEFLQSATGRTFEELKREAKLLQKLQNSKQTAKYIKDSTQPTFVEKMLWYRNNCLLSGPVTHGTYLEANLVNAVMRPLETAVAAKLGEFSKAEERVYPGEAGAMLYAMINPNAFKNAAESWREHIAVLPGDQGKKYTSIAFNKQMIEGPLGTGLHQVSRAINALHSFVYTMAYEQNIASLSFRQAVKEGLDPASNEFAARLADLRANQSPEMMSEATTEAFKEVNMGKSGPVLGKLSLFLNSNAVTRFMYPFVKMEMNVLKNTYFERTPLGLISKDIRANLVGANGEIARDMQRAKIIATTGLAGVLFTMGSQFVNADGPSDPNKNRVWRMTHIPNSIQIGDTAFSLKGLGRVGTLLRFGASMKESVGGWEGDDGEHIVKALVEHTSHSILDSSFTEGIKNSIDFAFHSKEKAGAFIQNFATQFLPFSVGMGQIAHVVDPFKRDTKTEDEEGLLGFADKVMKASLARIPGASYLLEPEYDMFGAPIAHDSDYYDRYKDDTTVQRMNALHMGIGALKSDVFGVKLSGKEKADYAQIAGILTKETLDRIITPEFANHPLEAQVKAIHDTITDCREHAKQLLMQKYPEIRDNAIAFQRTAHGIKSPSPNAQ